MRVRKHIREALSEAGLLVNTEDKASYDPGNYGKWKVVEDNSIEVPEHSPYSCFQVEVRSPAFYFEPEALREVTLACEALRDTFCLRIEPICALHVHTGQGHDSFDFDTIRKLVAFL